MAKHRGLTPFVLAAPAPGDFCCVPITGVVGQGIQVGEWLAGDRFQPYDHAQVYVGRPDASGPYGYTYSAYPDDGKGTITGKRALPCPPAALPGAIWSSGIIKLTQVQRGGIIRWCLEHPSVQYSALDYLAIATKRVFHLPIAGLQSYIASSAHMICSQYTDTALLEGAGVHLFSDGRWPGEVTPGDLAELLQTLGHTAAMRP